MAMVIVALAAVAVTLVHLRRAEATCRHEMQRLRLQRVQLRREVWQRQAEVGRITAPLQVRRLCEGRPVRDGVEVDLPPGPEQAAAETRPEPARHARPRTGNESSHSHSEGSGRRPGFD
jgi:hypothetical protein